MTQPRKFVGVRLNPGGVDAIDQLAAQHGKTRSFIIRALLAFALRSIGKNWRP